MPMPETPEAVHDRGGSGYEHRDVDVRQIGMLGGALLVCGAIMHVLLWELHRRFLPEANGRDVSPPVQMPEETTVNRRLEEVSQPRLEGLLELKAQPPLYRSSQPEPGTSSPQFHPED